MLLQTLAVTQWAAQVLMKKILLGTFLSNFFSSENFIKILAESLLIQRWTNRVQTTGNPNQELAKRNLNPMRAF